LNKYPILNLQCEKGGYNGNFLAPPFKKVDIMETFWLHLLKRWIYNILRNEFKNKNIKLNKWLLIF